MALAISPRSCLSKIMPTQILICGNSQPCFKSNTHQTTYTNRLRAKSGYQIHKGVTSHVKERLGSNRQPLQPPHALQAAIETSQQLNPNSALQSTCTHSPTLVTLWLCDYCMVTQFHIAHLTCLARCTLRRCFLVRCSSLLDSSRCCCDSCSFRRSSSSSPGT